MIDSNGNFCPRIANLQPRMNDDGITEHPIIHGIDVEVSDLEALVKDHMGEVSTPVHLFARMHNGALRIAVWTVSYPDEAPKDGKLWQVLEGMPLPRVVADQ